MRVDLKYLIQDTDRHGNVRRYLRMRGYKKVRLQGEPGSPEFAASYSNALLSAEPLPSRPQVAAGDPGTLRRLCTDYYATDSYRNLGARTRYVRKLTLDRICTTVGADGIQDGARLYADMTPDVIGTMRDAPEGPEAGNAIVKALRQVFKATKQPNPAAAVEYRRPNNLEGFHPWTVEEVHQFEARHPIGTKARLALALLLYTGARRSDAVRLGPQMARNGALRFVEFKGRERKRKERELPILAPLQQVIDATACGHLAYLVTEHGKPYSRAGFGNWFRRRCRDAGLQNCSAHGLRKAAATIAAENGATAHQLMAIFGWTNIKEAQRYTEAADKRRMAREAMHHLVRQEGELVPLPSHEKSHRK
jgi:site-specific recombinase XerD